jgi:hypothetical protein
MKALYITIALALVASAGVAQTKIGNITISDSLAQRYFLYLYQHPDTVSEKSEDDYRTIHWNADHTSGYADPETFEQGQQIKNMVNEFNGNLHHAAIGKAYKSVHYKAHIDTEWKDMWFGTGGSGHSKDYTKIVNVPDTTEQEFIGFLVPRKPTEQDFIKWMAKHSK